jgi:hypothetical protein
MGISKEKLEFLPQQIRAKKITNSSNNKLEVEYNL